MKKKILTTVVAITFVCTIAAACGPAEREENHIDSGQTDHEIDRIEEMKQDETEKNSNKTEVETAETEIYGYPSEDAGVQVFESELGYSLTYDPTFFTLDDTGEGDTFSYHTAESIAIPVYISVQSYGDMDAGTLADGIILQSGLDGVAAEDVYFGADSIEAKNVAIEREDGGVTQTQIFYAIPKGEGSILLEVGGYEGMPEMAEVKFEEMLGTFRISE